MGIPVKVTLPDPSWLVESELAAAFDHFEGDHEEWGRTEQPAGGLCDHDHVQVDHCKGDLDLAGLGCRVHLIH